MKLKKVLCSLLAFALSFTMSFSSVFATGNETTATLDNAYDKIVNYYKSKTELKYKNEIIAVEALGLEAEDYTIALEPDELKTETSNQLSKLIISLVLIGENPTKYEGKNLVELLESKVDENGKVLDSYNVTATDVWVYFALRTVESPKATLVLNNLKNSANKDGIYGYKWDGVDCVDVDTSAMVAVAYSLDNPSNYETESKPLYDLFSDATTKQNSINNTNTIAWVLESYLMADKDLDAELVDLLVSFQNDAGSFGWNDKDENVFATFDAAHLLGAYKNGSVFDKAKANYKALTSKPNDSNNGNNQNSNNSNQQNNQNNQNTNQNTNNQTQQTTKPTTDNKVSKDEVKTGDESLVSVYMTMMVLSAVIFFVAKRRYE